MTCDVCHGSGYAPEVLKYLYKDKNIAEILKMTVAEASNFLKIEFYSNNLIL